MSNTFVTLFAEVLSLLNVMRLIYTDIFRPTTVEEIFVYELWVFVKLWFCHSITVGR